MAVYADRLAAVVSDCGKAAKSSDARDKYFLSHVGESDPFPAKTLRSELPALESAQASLASTASDLADVLPQLSSCHGVALTASRSVRVLPAQSSVLTSRHGEGAAAAVDTHSGFEQGALDLLLREARTSIIGVRSVLA